MGRKGFSLIELIIVVALIGILAAIATPQLLQMMPGMSANSATRQVMADMYLTKMRAVSENRKYRIKFVPAGRQYSFQQDGNRDDDFYDSADTTVRTASLPDGIVFETNADRDTSDDPICADHVCFGVDNAASFTPTGSGDAGSVYLIPQIDKAIGRNDRMRAISVNKAGRIKPWKFKGGSTTWTAF